VKIFSQTAGALSGTGNFVQFLTMDLNPGAHAHMMLSIVMMLLIAFILLFSTHLKMKNYIYLTATN